MTKKLEDFFNIKSKELTTEESNPEINVSPIRTKEELMEEATQIYSSLTTTEKIDYALPTVTDLEKHDTEMDDIASRAIKSFEDLSLLGGNVPDIHAGKIYEVAGQMLKTALEAKNAKAEKKLRMIELQLKKVRAEQIEMESGNGDRRSNGNEFDRNELLKYISDRVSNKSE